MAELRSPAQGWLDDERLSRSRWLTGAEDRCYGGKWDEANSMREHDRKESKMLRLRKL